MAAGEIWIRLYRVIERRVANHRCGRSVLELMLSAGFFVLPVSTEWRPVLLQITAEAGFQSHVRLADPACGITQHERTAVPAVCGSGDASVDALWVTGLMLPVLQRRCGHGITCEGIHSDSYFLIAFCTFKQCQQVRDDASSPIKPMPQCEFLVFVTPLLIFIMDPGA